jgi:hypothetical protein
MPDTKSGRERNGRNKRRQLLERLNRREIETLEADDDLPSFEEAEGAFLADELPDE